MPNMRFDLHLHTEFSPDCDTDLSEIEAHCLTRGLTGIAVTDHDTIEGAVRLRDRVRNLRVIVSEEVSTREGDVIGLFIERHVPPKMSALDTMLAIHEQGGLVYLPHPFDKLRARRNGGASLTAVIEQIDIVETFNGKVGRDLYNTLAVDFARQYQKVSGGGSDAHTLRAIGTVYNEFDAPQDYSGPAEFLAYMATSHLVGKRRSPLGGWLVRGRRPFNLAWRRLRRKNA